MLDASSPGTATATPRERFRAQIRTEAKAVALRQLAGGGLAAVSINAIAKELGVSGPALYRYFASRDDLLDQLVLDAYADLADAVEGAGEDVPEGASPIPSYAAAYRAWARAHPHRYRLLFGQPHAAHDGHRPQLIAATDRLMMLLLAGLTVEAAAEAGTGSRRSAAPVDPVLADQLRAWAAGRDLHAAPPLALTAISIWAELHGWARLEIDGNFASMGLDATLLPDGAGARA